MLFVIDDKSISGTTEEMTEINQFNEQLRSNGYWVMAAGLGSPNSAQIIDNREDLNYENPGSLFNTPEFYSGFWIIDVPTHELARQFARAGSKACNRKVELRPFLN